MFTIYTFRINMNNPEMRRLKICPNIAVPVINGDATTAKLILISKGYDIIDDELDSVINEVNNILEP